MLDLLFFVSFFRFKGDTYYFDNCSSTSIKVDTAIIKSNRGSSSNGYCICFSVKKETSNSYLLRRNCEDTLSYICEQSMLKESNLLFKQVLPNSALGYWMEISISKVTKIITFSFPKTALFTPIREWCQ